MSPALGAFGDAYARTPNLDRLARDGVRYTAAYASAPICSPSRSALITGVYASSLGTQHLRSSIRIPASIRTLPEYLRERGYYTSNNSKTDYNFDPSGRWDERGDTPHWRHRRPGQPFFSVFNFMTTHEGPANDRDEKVLEAASTACQLGDCTASYPELTRYLRSEDRPWDTLLAAAVIRDLGERARPLLAEIQAARKRPSGAADGRYRDWMFSMFVGFALDQALAKLGSDWNVAKEPEAVGRPSRSAPTGVRRRQPVLHTSWNGLWVPTGTMRHDPSPEAFESARMATDPSQGTNPASHRHSCRITCSLPKAAAVPRARPGSRGSLRRRHARSPRETGTPRGLGARLAAGRALPPPEAGAAGHPARGVRRRATASAILGPVAWVREEP
jgi:hypothetical protein